MTKEFSEKLGLPIYYQNESNSSTKYAALFFLKVLTSIYGWVVVVGTIICLLISTNEFTNQYFENLKSVIFLIGLVNSLTLFIVSAACSEILKGLNKIDNNAKYNINPARKTRLNEQSNELMDAIKERREQKNSDTANLG